jgi:hypothetical protein
VPQKGRGRTGSQGGLLGHEKNNLYLLWRRIQLQSHRSHHRRFFIAGLASFLGIGGGFLFVPFLTSIAGLPMFLVAGTSALTVLVGMIISIITYMGVKGVPVFWPLIGVELIGIFVGSMIGPERPNTSRTSGSSASSWFWPSTSDCVTPPRVSWGTASYRRFDQFDADRLKQPVPGVWCRRHDPGQQPDP